MSSANLVICTAVIVLSLHNSHKNLTLLFKLPLCINNFPTNPFFSFKCGFDLIIFSLNKSN